MKIFDLFIVLLKNPSNSFSVEIIVLSTFFKKRKLPNYNFICYLAFIPYN